MLKWVPLTLQRDKKGLKWLDKRQNRRDLKHFLDLHDIDMDLTAKIEFTRKGFTAWVYETNEDGEKVAVQVGSQKMAKTRVVEKTYLCDIPTFS